MNYWLLTTEYPPMHGGGISTYCYHTGAMLFAAGCKVTVFVHDDTVTDHIIIQEQYARVVKFNNGDNELRSFLGHSTRVSYAFAAIVRRFIEKEGKPDLVETQDYLGIGYYLTQFKQAGYAFMEGVPVIMTLHSPAFIYLLYNRVPVYRYPDYWTGEMEKQAIVAADLLISPSKYMAEELQKHVPAGLINPVIIANPYKTTAIGEQPMFNRNKIVYYGKLSVQKGSFALLELLRERWDNGFPHPLYMIGGTDIVFHPEMKTMGELVKSKYAQYINNGRLHLQGKIQPGAINASLQDAHVVIVPSIVDNMPYVVMEAMELGKIVLVSQQGGQAGMVEDGVSGFIFDHEVPGSFARQLDRVLALTDEEIAIIGQQARKSVQQQFGYEAVATQKLAAIKALKLPAVSTHFPFLYQEPVQPGEPAASLQQLLSVVIPFHNMGAYIDECVDSVLKSQYQPIEIIIINDGSTDAASIEKLKQLPKQAAVKIINRPHQGLAAARNFGAAAAGGAFLAFLDADDKVHPAYYEKAVQLLQQKDNVYFVGCWVQYFQNSRQAWATFTPQPPYALVHNPVNSSSLVYKRAAFLTAGLNDRQTDYGMEDYESVVHMLKKGFNGVVLPEILFYYRVRSGSMFRNITNAKLLHCCRYIAEKHAAYYKKFSMDIIHLLNANGPGYLYDNPGFEVTVTAHNKQQGLIYSKISSFIKKRPVLKKMALRLVQLKSGI